MELVVVLLVLVMLFGATRLADLGGSLGKGIKEFRQAVKEEEGDEKSAAAPQQSSSQEAFANGHQETVAAVKCVSCGGLSPVEARFCSQCGAAMARPVS